MKKQKLIYPKYMERDRFIASLAVDSQCSDVQFRWLVMLCLKLADYGERIPTGVRYLSNRPLTKKEKEYAKQLRATIRREKP